MSVGYGIRDIEVFVRIIDGGSFKDAAAALHVTQSALTQRLKKLEDALGAKLIDRTTRRLAPTAVGRAFLPSARRLLEQFEQAALDIRDVIDMTGGRVAVASLISAATFVLPAAVARFQTAHPGVGVRVFDVAQQEIEGYVRRGDVEFGIDMRTGDADPELRATPLLDDPFVLACRDDHPLADGGEIDAADLGDCPVITLGSKSGTSRVLQTQLAGGGRSPSWTLEVQHLSTLMGFLERGIGVDVVPRMVMRGMRGRGLVARPIRGRGLDRTLVVIERRGRALSPAAQALKGTVVGTAAGFGGD